MPAMCGLFYGFKLPDKSYEDGVRDGELKALVGRVNSLEVVVVDGFKVRDIKLTALEHAVWMLYGAIALMGFIVPMVWKWALK